MVALPIGAQPQRSSMFGSVRIAGLSPSILVRVVGRPFATSGGRARKQGVRAHEAALMAQAGSRRYNLHVPSRLVRSKYTSVACYIVV